MSTHSDQSVFVGILVSGPDYPSRAEPLEVRVSATREPLAEWNSSFYGPSRAGNAPHVSIYECKVEKS